MTAILNKPSSFIHEVCTEKAGDGSLFKFSESLQQCMEMLLEKKKADQLSAAEVEKLEAIEEPDQIFTYISAMTAA
ncbi:hypothetical protein [Phormidesmis priestleyi]